MTTVGLAGAVVGIGAGALHAQLLWKHVNTRAGLSLLRLPLVAVVLVAAALLGGLGAAALGWAAGFVAGGAIELLAGRRSRP